MRTDMMRGLLLAAVLTMAAHAASAADRLSGAWSTDAQTFIFKAQPGNRFWGVVCGPCDDPSAIFRIEDGKVIDDEHATFSIAYDVGGPLFKKVGAYREHVTATWSGDGWVLAHQRAGGTEKTTGAIRRVVPGYEGLPAPKPAITTPAPDAKPSPIEGRWIAAGRNAQQNFTLKIRGNSVWGVICGPCRPEGVFLLDDGSFDGETVTFYINHMDTPPSARKFGINRNHMRGKLVGNVMKFTWVREEADDQPGGEMTLIGPIR